MYIKQVNIALWVVVGHDNQSTPNKIYFIIKLKNNTWRKYIVFRSRDMGRAVAVRRWTATALDCYKRGCNCEGCFYKDFFSGSSQKCQMKASVLELVRVLGTPNVELQQIISD